MKSKLHCRQFFIMAGTLAALFMAAPHAASATDSVECDTTCDGGNKMISYADGNTVTCACVAESQMEPTVPDPEVVEGTVNQDVE